MTIHLLLVAIRKLDDKVRPMLFVLANLRDGGTHMLSLGGVVKDRITHVKLRSGN
jgi:hypothetical protein